MNATTACSDFEAHGTAARYAAGNLDAPREEEFERHLIGCAGCQDTVRLAAGARAALRAKPALRTWWTRRRGTVATAAAAAVLAIAFIGNAMLHRTALTRLGAVSSMPGYESIEVRATAHEADSLFVRGMRLYQQGRFDESLPLLASARTLGADSTVTSFFMGVVELRAERPRAAVAALSHALRRPSPYAPEAHYYAAKAWLQLARPDSAVPHLRQAAGAEGPIGAAAGALADSLESLRR